MDDLPLPRHMTVESILWFKFICRLGIFCMCIKQWKSTTAVLIVSFSCKCTKVRKQPRFRSNSRSTWKMRLCLLYFFLAESYKDYKRNPSWASRCPWSWYIWESSIISTWFPEFWFLELFVFTNWDNGE